MNPDKPKQLSLAFKDGTGALELIGGTIYSIGADDNYIVLKQHPTKTDSGDFDPNITN